MNFKIPHKIEDKFKFADLGDASLCGSICVRMDNLIHERVSGKFAIDEILKEAELEIKEKYDDQFGESKHCLWRGEFWGKLMLSAVRTCRVKKDEKLKEDIRQSVYRVISYQDEDGYIGTYYHKDRIAFEDKNIFNWNIWSRKYILWALIEAGILLDDNHIIDCAKKLLDHIIKQLKEQNISITDAGVMHGLPSSSILKPVLILYRLTANDRYLDFAKEIVAELDREDGKEPNIIRNALSGKRPSQWYNPEEGWQAKAYEMMSSFDGLIEYYRITGEERVIEATKAFWELLIKYESNVLGSVGYCELFYDAKDYPNASNEICDVIHWMRLCHELYKIFGEAKYMEHFEKAFLNAFLAGIYENGKQAAVFIRSSGRHQVADPQCATKYQQCCIDNAPRGFANATESSVAKGDGGYYINTYYEAMANFGKKDFYINAGYLTNGTVSIKLRNMDDGDKVYLRIPSWSKNTVVTYGYYGNENSIDDIVCGTYCEVTLPEGESVITIKFDITPRIYDFEGEFIIPDDGDYHIRRWIDPNEGLCNKDAMVKHPMSVVYKGALLLARSKRLGCKEEDMFSGKTVRGKDVKCSIRNFYHPYSLVLASNLVTFETEDETFTYRMCDYASACNMNTEDGKYFTINI